MKKFLIYLIAFCLVFCVICTACAKIPQNTDGSSEPTKSTSYKKPYEVCYTSIRETKALATEIPNLQAKIDRNYDAQGSRRKYQNKVVIQIGDQRDVPCLFEMGGGQFFHDEYIIHPYFAGSPNFSELSRNSYSMPTYIYTGTEAITIELNDEIYFMTDPDSHETELNKIGSFTVRSLDGETVTWESFGNFEQMYEKLPKGKYYINFLLQVYGNHIFREDGKYIGLESKSIVPAFIVEIK